MNTFRLETGNRDKALALSSECAVHFSWLQCTLHVSQAILCIALDCIALHWRETSPVTRRSDEPCVSPLYCIALSPPVYVYNDAMPSEINTMTSFIMIGLHLVVAGFWWRWFGISTPFLDIWMWRSWICYWGNLLLPKLWKLAGERVKDGKDGLEHASF